jgi:hypothetical protein
MIFFGLVLKLEVSYNRVITSCGILVFFYFRGFFFLKIIFFAWYLKYPAPVSKGSIHTRLVKVENDDNLASEREI